MTKKFLNFATSLYLRDINLNRINMKKLVLSLAAVALAATMSAQTFTVTVAGEAVENGSTVTNGNFVADLLQFNMYQINPEVFVTSDKDCHAYIQIEAVEGDAQICAFGNCVPVANGKTVVKEGDMTAGVAINTEIESATSTTKEGAYTKAVITVWNDENENSEIKFTLIMDGDASGVNQILTSKAVNFANNAINYDLTNGSVEVYTLGGSLVKSVNVNGNGSVDLSTLPSALYIYRVKDGKKVATGKALIK